MQISILKLVDLAFTYGLVVCTGNGAPDEGLQVWGGRCARFRANAAHTRQSRPDPGLGLQGKVLERLQVVLYSLKGGDCKLFCLCSKREIGRCSVFARRWLVVLSPLERDVCQKQNRGARRTVPTAAPGLSSR